MIAAAGQLAVTVGDSDLTVAGHVDYGDPEAMTGKWTVRSDRLDCDAVGALVETLTGRSMPAAAGPVPFDGLEVQVSELKSYQADLEARLSALTAEHTALKTAAKDLESSLDFAEVRTRLGAEMHTHMMTDSKVPHAVIDGVGKFLDFGKYLGEAAEAGARDAVKQSVGRLSSLK